MEPFPQEVPVPPGTVTPILRGPGGFKVPPLAFSLLLVLVIAPFPLWGKSKWWVSVLGLVVWGLVAAIVRDDPQALTSWSGEMRLDDAYD